MCSSSSILKFSIRVTCCRARVCVLGIFDLADVKWRKSAFKRGFSANVAKEPSGRPSMNEAYTCAHKNVQQKWATTRRDYEYTRDGERARERKRNTESEWENLCFAWFLSQNVLSFRFQFLYGSDVFHFFFVSFVLCLHNLVFQNMEFMRFCLMLRIDPFIFFLYVYKYVNAPQISCHFLLFFQFCSFFFGNFFHFYFCWSYQKNSLLFVFCAFVHSPLVSA